MKFVDGWHCPDLLSGPRNYRRRLTSLEPHFERIPRRRAAIQAGGHIGIWPKYLSALFEAVYTFEPDAANFACLAMNTRDARNVFAARGLLGDVRGPRGLFESKKSTGQHRVKGSGVFPVYRIDDLGLDDVDVIALDVEGFEIHALRGAEKTIKRSRPVVIAEENRRAIEQGFAIGELIELMSDFGYSAPHAVDEDLIFEPDLRP